MSPVVLGLDCPQESPFVQPPLADDKETRLAQSHKWPVGFGVGSSLELVVRDQGHDIWVWEDIEEDLLGDFPYPLGVFSPATFLDWALVGDSCEGIKDTKENHPRKVKGVRPKPKSRRELLNLDAYDTSSRRGKGKAHAALRWVLSVGSGLRAFGVLRIWVLGLFGFCVFLLLFCLVFLLLVLVRSFLCILHIYLVVPCAFLINCLLLIK
jgi:hypothetical protein